MERMVGNPLEIDPPPAELLAHRDRCMKDLELLDGGFIDGPLHVLVGGRATGKTRLAMRWLSDAPEGVTRVLIVPTEQAAMHHRREQGFRANDERIISWRRLRNRLSEDRGRRDAGFKVEYGIDETAEILAQMLGLPSTPALVTVLTASPWQNRTS